MFCGKCGVENRDGARFCKSCGRPLRSNVDTQPHPQHLSHENNTGNEPDNPDMNQGEKENPSQLKDKLQKIPKKAFIGGGVGVVALIVVIAFLIISGKTIDLNKYLKIETSGYNGYGTATVSIDWNKLKKEHGSDLAFTSAARQLYGVTSKMMTPTDLTRTYVSVVLDKNSNLSDGDVINYKWTIDPTLSKYIDGRITCSEGSIKVSNLKEVGKFDAFANVSVQFSGDDPYGRASIKYNGSELTSYNFKCNKTAGLKNGDTIEVTIEADMSAIAKKYGKVPDSTKKEYTVSGLREYIDSCSDLTDDCLKKMKNEAEDVIHSYIAKSINESSSAKNLEYVGNYVLKKKEMGVFEQYHNYVIIVYTADVSDSDGKFQTTKVFFPVYFTSVQTQGDGTIAFKSGRDIFGTSKLPGSDTRSIKGYVDGSSMYESIITKNRAEWSYDVSEALKEYGE